MNPNLTAMKFNSGTLGFSNGIVNYKMYFSLLEGQTHSTKFQQEKKNLAKNNYDE